MTYARILFPDRAEDMRQNPKLKGYRIFLSHWPQLISFLKTSYERVVTRHASYALILYGPQGIGKTLLADKLQFDFQTTKEGICKGNISFDQNNLWHKISGNFKYTDDVINATNNSAILDCTDLDDWVDVVEEWAKNNKDRTKIVILDNAERAYFGATLAKLNPAEYLSQIDNPHMFVHIAQQFIRLARTQLGGTLFLILGNNQEMLSKFHETCESQHKGMVVFNELPLPSGEEKESIVRINVNRLNRVSYWYCVDKSGPEKKKELYEKLRGISTFPDAFSAVDEAFTESQARQGRPANKCLLTLAVLVKDFSNNLSIAECLSGRNDTIKFKHEVAELYIITDNYCQKVLPNNKDQAKMLESEFSLRLLVLHNLWIQKLLSGNPVLEKLAIDCLNALLVHPRVGFQEKVRIDIEATQKEKCDALLNVPGGELNLDKDFWPLGAVRAAKYESVLKRYYEGYNTAFFPGFSKRPDILIEPYEPCSVLKSRSNTSDDINVAIRRKCHSVEVTAQNNATSESVASYLASKLTNYIELVKEN